MAPPNGAVGLIGAERDAGQHVVKVDVVGSEELAFRKIAPPLSSAKLLLNVTLTSAAFCDHRRRNVQRTLSDATLCERNVGQLQVGVQRFVGFAVHGPTMVGLAAAERDVGQPDRLLDPGVLMASAPPALIAALRATRHRSA
jgi:hypothetical protein